MRTVAETPVFIRYAAEIWSDAERQEFISYIAAKPGCRFSDPRQWRVPEGSVSRSGTGKSGGARVIYFVAVDDVIWLLIAYAKAKYDSLPSSFLAQLRQGVEDAL